MILWDESSHLCSSVHMQEEMLSAPEFALKSEWILEALMTLF